MPREKREKANSKIYHVMCRALNKQTLFDEEEDCLFYLKQLKESSQKYKVGIYGYCLMTNHVHILIFDKSEMMNQFMKSINTSYAKYYNKKYGRTGYVFNDRYHSEPEKSVAVMKLIDISIPLMQLSRVSGIYYNKI